MTGPGETPPRRDLGTALAGLGGELDLCVHCGFCLPACPTYLRLGDEADSPRGRLHLMRAVAEGRLDAGSDAFRTHIDRCLGCRACEPVCPSGVPYGALLEHAREAIVREGNVGLATRGLLAAFGSPRWSAAGLALSRGLRGLGLARTIARRLPRRGRLGALRRGLLMLAGSAPWRPDRFGASDAATTSGADAAPSTGGATASSAGAAADSRTGPAAASGTGTGGEPTARAREISGSSPRADSKAGAPAPATVVFEGCVQRGLFSRINRATETVLRVNGYPLRPAPGQACCGALHAHAGDLEGARRLAKRNVAAFEGAGAEIIAVNAAGCGAALREYGAWLADDPTWRDRASTVAARTVDVTELLIRRGPVRGAAVVGAVAYHPPCHLEHAQGVTRAPEAVLRAIPGLELRRAERATECCGGAGIYGLTHPELGGRIGVDKARALADTEAACVVTGNPGCMMQIAAFLHDENDDVDVAHPVELLLESYRRAGYDVTSEGLTPETLTPETTRS